MGTCYGMGAICELQVKYEELCTLLKKATGAFPQLGVPVVTIMENQMEKKMENEMETEVI